MALAGGGLLLLLVLAGTTYQYLGNRFEARRFPEPGRLVDTGDLKLQLSCTGAGSPTVILESGLGDGLTTWRRVQPEIARFARVCSYDRAGYGASDPGPMPRTSAHIAAELHALLVSAGERPPYVLVGHSFGGYNVRVFAGQYPELVAGMVLVDSTQEDQYHLLPPSWNTLGTAMRKRWRSQATWAPAFIGLGIARWMVRSQGARDPHLMLQSKVLHTRASELDEIQVSAEQARAAGILGDKPLIVLTAANTADAGLRAALGDRDLEAYQHTWIDDLQLRLARLSTRGRRILVPDSGHDMPTDRPDAIVTAVREVSIHHERP